MDTYAFGVRVSVERGLSLLALFALLLPFVLLLVFLPLVAFLLEFVVELPPLYDCCCCDVIGGVTGESGLSRAPAVIAFCNITIRAKEERIKESYWGCWL